MRAFACQKSWRVCKRFSLEVVVIANRSQMSFSPNELLSCWGFAVAVAAVVVVAADCVNRESIYSQSVATILVYRLSLVVSGVGFQGSNGSLCSSACAEYPLPYSIVGPWSSLPPSMSSLSLSLLYPGPKSGVLRLCLASDGWWC